jgi:hypothetical protein
MMYEKLEVSRDGKSLGFFTSADIRKALKSGRLLYTDYYHQAHKDRWVRLSAHFPDLVKTEEASNTERVSYGQPGVNSSTNRTEIVLPLSKKGSLNHEISSNFTCQCCLTDFDKPRNLSPTMSVSGSLLSPVGILLILANGKYSNALGLGLLAYGSALIVTASLAYPHCPSCRSPSIKKNQA